MSKKCSGRALCRRGLLVLLLLLSFAAIQKMGHAAETDDDSNCLACHTNAGYLMQAVKPAKAQAEDGCARAPSRPDFLSAFVNQDFVGTVHGKIGCVGCHSGDASATDQQGAHTGMQDAEAGCVACHSGIVEKHATSLHGSLNGMGHALNLRSGEENFEKLAPVWQADCASCHASCSDCHLTLPGAVGGGLIKGHEFFGRPPMEETCAVCHGTRAGGEYLGHWEGVEPDVHFKAGMHCLDCHKNDMHGDEQAYSNRWQVSGRALCTDCHAALPNDKAAAHNIKHENVSCQVCHAQPYQNCFSCHTSVSDEGYERHAGKKSIELKIGRNTSTDYPHDIVTLRSNPVARHSFKQFGDNLMPEFDDYPTWKTAAPHSILRVTEQNRSCGNCHGEGKHFLSIDDLDPQGAKANQSVIMPPPIDLGQ